MKNLLIVLLSIFGMTAYGQTVNQSPVVRKGFVIGFGVGGGVISISDSNLETDFDEAQGGLSLPNLKLGWMVNERTAILATFPGMLYELEGKDRSFEAVIPSVQYWVQDRWWINGGFGLAMDFPAFYEVKDVKEEDWNLGCAVAASTGYEIFQRKNFTIDLQTRLQLGRAFLDNDDYRDGVAFTVGVGFNWY